MSVVRVVRACVRVCAYVRACVRACVRANVGTTSACSMLTTRVPEATRQRDNSVLSKGFFLHHIDHNGMEEILY